MSPDASAAKDGVSNRGWEKQPQTKHLREQTEEEEEERGGGSL